MRELSYIVLKDLGPCSLGLAQQVLYSNGDIFVRIQVDLASDTQQFRKLIQFLHSKPLKGLPKIVRFGQIAGNTVLVISPQVGKPLSEVFQEREISSAQLDKWWHQMQGIAALLSKRGLFLGTFTPETLMVSKSDELLIPIFSLSDGTKLKNSPKLSESDDLTEIEELFISAVSPEGSVVNQSSETVLPQLSRVVLRSKSKHREKSDSASGSRTWIKSLRWLPTVVLGIACLVSFTRVSSWAESLPQISQQSALNTSTISTPELSRASVRSPKILPEDRGVAAAERLLAKNMSTAAIDEEYAKNLLTALETIRDHALNNLDYSEFMKVNVVGSPAAETEAKLFHNLLDSGYRLKKYRMSFSEVRILQSTPQELIIRAEISQEEFLKCAHECVSVPPESPRSVEVVLVPRPWRIRQILRQN